MTSPASRDAGFRAAGFREELVAATARANHARSGLRRFYLVALAAALALIPTGVAAAAVGGVFSLPGGAKAEHAQLSCTQHGDSFTITALAGPNDQRFSVRARGRCPDLSGTRIVSDPAGRHIAPLYAHIRVNTDGPKPVVHLDVVGRAADGRDIVISTTTRSHLGKTAHQLGLTPPPSYRPTHGNARQTNGGGASHPGTPGPTP